MAKDTLFASDHQAAKASVVLKLRSNKPLSPATAIGITGLIAASVESLTPEAVVILDTFGRSLSKPVEDGNEPGSGQQLDRQRRVEHDLSAKVMSMLEPVMGPGHVRVNVTARLNSNSEEETAETFDPATVVRSRQTSTDAGGGLLAGGVAGAPANIPPPTTPAGAPIPPVAAPPAVPMIANHSAETTNYEVSKVTRHRIVPPGQIARLTVAVVLDDERVASKAAGGAVTMTAKPRTPTDLQRIQHLVAAAVGVDMERGDEVTVENIAFGENSTEEESPATGWWQRMSPQLIGTGGIVMQVVRLAAIVTIAALAFFMILRPIGRRALQLPAPVKVVTAAVLTEEQQAVKTVGDLEDEMEAALLSGRSGLKRLPVLTRLLDKTAQQQPEHVARLVRGWLTEEEAV
jgi:flagellar M-ring protein FliF